ncbi:MAG: 2-succinyl-5-enolpyruvyl-6-hydroxy-3-cyclohexene-1-carboxylic-acid synthase [Jiangellaceae bacterium]
MNPSTALSTVLVDELARNGVRDVVLAPGSRSAPLAFALHAADAAGRLRLHVRIDERSAGFTALGMARSDGRPAAVVTTSGTAVANLHPAVLEAHHAGIPVLVLTADRPDELRGVGANQTTDQVGIFAGAVRLFHEFAAPDTRPGQVAYWRSAVSRACIAARGTVSGDPGPVHLDVAFRNPLVPDGDESWPESLDGRDGNRPWTDAVGSPSVSAGQGPGRSELVADAETVVVLGDAPAVARAATWELAERRGWPVIAEPWSQARDGGVPCGRLVVGSSEWLRRNAPERVLVVDRPTLSRQVAHLISGSIAPVDVVTSGPRWPDHAHAARRVFTASELWDATGTGGDAPDAGGSSPLRLTWVAAGARAREAAGQVLDQSLAGDTLPSGTAAARAVLRGLPDDAVLFLGSSSVVRDVDLVGERLPTHVLANRGVSGIDGTVSSAVGAALARGRTDDVPTYAVMGDLTFLHDTNGLVVGPHEPQPDLCIVVLNDDGGGIFALLEQGAPEHAAAFERVFGTPHRTDLGALCAATRTPHERVHLEDLDAALAPQKGVRVVEVAVDRSTHRELHARIRKAVAAALE